MSNKKDRIPVDDTHVESGKEKVVDPSYMKKLVLVATFTDPDEVLYYRAWDHTLMPDPAEGGFYLSEKEAESHYDRITADGGVPSTELLHVAVKNYIPSSDV